MSRDPATPDGRTRSLAFGGLLVGGLAALITGSQPWWRTGGSGVARVTFSGVDATAGLTAALAVVVLAGTVLALALRRTGRRVLAVLLAVAAAAIAVVGLLRLRPGVAQVTEKVRQVSLTNDFQLTGTGWSNGYAAAGLIALAGAVLMAVRAGRWPQRADRFSRQGTEDAENLAALTDPDEDPTQWWKAQDAGLDPTRAPTSAPNSAPSSAPSREPTREPPRPDPPVS